MAETFDITTLGIKGYKWCILHDCIMTLCKLDKPVSTFKHNLSLLYSISNKLNRNFVSLYKKKKKNVHLECKNHNNHIAHTIFQSSNKPFKTEVKK